MPSHISTARRWTAPLAAVIASLALAPAASAAPDTPFTTSNPDLQSVALTDQIEVGDGTPNRVRYCFDTQVSGTLPIDSAAGVLNFDYYLAGYDSDKAAYTGGLSGVASNPQVDPAQPNCLVVDFSDATDVSQFTIGGVDADVVRRAPGTTFVQGNAADSAPLGGNENNTGAAAGRTEGPDLLSATPRPATNEIDFRFDEELLGGLCVPSSFGYYTVDATSSGGIRHTGDGCTVSGRTVTVSFLNIAPDFDDVNQATRMVVTNIGVLDVPTASAGSFAFTKTNWNPIGTSTGTPTNSPDLIDATRVNKTQVDYKFDELVIAPNPTGFWLTGEDSRWLLASQTTLLGDGKTIRATFPNSSRINDFDYPLAQALQGAVLGAQQLETSTDGSDPIATSKAAAGLTDGPDLIGSSFNSDTDEVTYKFDENLDDTSSLSPANFFVVDPNGDIRNGLGGSTQYGGPNEAMIRFPFDVDNRVGAGYVNHPLLDGLVGLGGGITDYATASILEIWGNDLNLGGFTATTGKGTGSLPATGSSGSGGAAGAGTGSTGSAVGAIVSTVTGAATSAATAGATPVTQTITVQSQSQQSSAQGSGLQRRLTPSALSARLSRSRDRKAPFTYTVAGRLAMPTGYNWAAGRVCALSNSVAIRALNGSKRIQTKTVKLRSDCSYRTTFTLSKRQVGSAKRVKFSVLYLGNQYLDVVRAGSVFGRVG